MLVLARSGPRFGNFASPGPGPTGFGPLIPTSDADIWPIRHGGLLGLKWIFTVNKPLLEFNFTSLYSILCSSLRDLSDDCRQVAVSIVLPIAEFICHDHLFRGIEIAQLAWALIKGKILKFHTEYQ